MRNRETFKISVSQREESPDVGDHISVEMEGHTEMLLTPTLTRLHSLLTLSFLLLVRL